MARSLRDKLRHLFAHKLFVLVALTLGLALTAPSITSGLGADDYIQRFWVREVGRCLDLFEFANGDPTALRMQKSSGSLPYWADDEMKVSFFRPLASISHCVDYRYLDAHPALMHLQNLAWLALVVVLGFLFYRRVLGPSVAAGLATLFFTVDEGNGKVAGWVANRNLLMVLTFGLLTLLLHDRARKQGSRKAAWGAVFAFALGLVSGEAAIATLAYLVAYALFLDEGPWKARLRSLVPYALVLVPWQLVYRYLGHGQSGSALYTNPLADPLTFAARVVERAPILLLSLFGGPASDTYPLVGAEDRRIWWIAAVGVLATLAVFLVRLVRRSKEARFFAMGLALAIVPPCGVFPGDRVLMFASVGSMGLIACFVSDAFRRVTEASTSGVSNGLTKGLAGILTVAHGIVAPIHQPIRSLEIAHIEEAIASHRPSLFRDTKPGDVVLALTAGENLYTCTSATVQARRQGIAVYAQCLTATTKPLSVVRLDAKRVILRAEDGFFDPLKEPFWNANKPWRPGDRIDLGWLRITIADVTELGIPREAVFHIHRNIDEPAVHLRYLNATQMAYEDAPALPVGAKLVIEGGQVKAFREPRARGAK